MILRFAVVAGILLGSATPVHAQTGALGVEDIIRLLELTGNPTDVVVGLRAELIREKCITFTLDSDASARLRDAGADEALLSVLRSACVTGPAATRRSGDTLFGEGSKAWHAARFDDALSSFRAAADAGHAEAAFFVGEVYRRGLGSTAEDFTEAARWYQRSAENGETMAMLALYRAHLGGRGVPRDWDEAERWARRAADAGNVDGMHMMGLLTKHRGGVGGAESLAWFRMAAERGDRFAMREVATFYHSGWVVPKNHAEAAQWFGRSAEAGLSGGYTNAGGLHEHGGFGLTADIDEAIRWYKLGAENNESESKQALARLGVSTQTAERTPPPSNPVVTQGSSESALKPASSDTATGGRIAATAGTEEGGSGAPMDFVLRVSLTNPINGHNATCYSNVVSVPAPKGFRDKWQRYDEANSVVASYFPQFLEKCRAAARSAKNALLNSVVSVLWNDTDDGGRFMLEQRALYQRVGFPGVHISP